MNNYEYENIILSGPDFFANTWQANFIIRDNANPKENIFSSFLKEKNIDDSLGFSALATRLSSLDIPSKSSEIGTIQYGNRTISKVSPKVNQAKTLNLNISLDQNFYLFDFFNVLSNSKIKSEIKAFTPEKGVNQSLLSILPSFYRNNLNYDNKNKSIIDMVVFYCAMKNGKDDSSFDILNKDNVVKIWEFTDIRFLGRSSNIVFNSGNTDSLNITIPITFKYLYETSLNFRNDLLKL